VVPDLVQNLALLVLRWSAIRLASIGKSHGLFHRPRPPKPVFTRCKLLEIERTFLANVVAVGKGGNTHRC